MQSLCSNRDDLPKYNTPISRLSLKIPSHTIILHNVFHKITSSRAPISINLKIRTRHVSFTTRERTATNLIAKILITRNQLRALWLLNVVQCQLNLQHIKKKNQTFLIKNVSVPHTHNYWKRRVNAYTKIASFWTLSTLYTVNPHDITPCVYLHVVALRRRSDSDFRIIQPFNWSNREIKKRISIKENCELSTNPRMSGRPVPPRGRSMPARIVSWRLSSCSLRALREPWSLG